MLTKINLQGVRSSRGFVVQRTARHELQYREGDRILCIEVESGVTETGEMELALYVDTIRSWLPPFEDSIIDRQKKMEIIRNIGEALDYLEVLHVFE